MIWNVVYVLMLLAAYKYGFMPWRDFRDVRLEKQAEARIFVEKHCTSEHASLRLQIGDLDQCKTAQKRLLSSPKFDAWEDYLQSLGIFPKSGLWGSLNIFEITGYAIGALVVLYFLGIALNLWLSMQESLRRLNTDSTLPGLVYKKVT